MTDPFAHVDDIFTEPEPDDDTLSNLGPLGPLAGTWQGRPGTDVHPSADGTETQEYTERFVLQPIDAQTNGPQLFYGLRYHQHVVKPGEIATFHDQVGYLLWEPATGRILMTLAIPRGQVAMAVGQVDSPDARSFTLRSSVGNPNAGIVTDDFLDWAFHTTSWEITFTIGDDDSWSYDQTTLLDVRGREPGFRHTDHCDLTRVAAAEPNPLAAAARESSFA